ncbi:MAG: hypothetical protein HC899_26005 [Leptolyngbyaceae cyanobacterium SM1_4_3]|nr:hypothetical protein [Leptolyngbyaceae cyanobacterium SM1_4_3]
MSRRYSRIRQGAILNAALNRYIQHLTDIDRTPNVGGGRDRSPTIELSIEPFGFEIDAGVGIRGTTTQRSRTIMSSAVGTRAITPTAGSAVQRIPGFKPSRAVLFVGTGASTVATSNITGLRYLKYGGENYSHAFGKSTATDAEFDAFSEIRTALIAGGSNRRVSYQAETRKLI